MADHYGIYFVGIGDQDDIKDEQLDEMFSRLIANVSPSLDKIITNHRLSINHRVKDHKIMTHIVSHRDHILVELAQKYGFPRGFCWVWKLIGKIPQLLGILDFVPKFSNDADFCPDLNQLFRIDTFGMKLSGSLIYTRSIVDPPNSNNYHLVISAKNSAYNEFTNTFVQYMKHKFTPEFVKALYDKNWTIGWEFIHDRLGGDHASRPSISIGVPTVVTTQRSDLYNFGVDSGGIGKTVDWEEARHFFDTFSIQYLPQYKVKDHELWKEWVRTDLIPNRSFFTLEPFQKSIQILVEKGIVIEISSDNKYTHVHSDILEGIVCTEISGQRFKFKFARYLTLSLLK